MGIIDAIKKDIQKSGGSKDKILFVRSDDKVRIRFLQDLDEGYEFTFHDSYELGLNALCLEELGKNCPLCGDERLRTRTLYAWSVYNYDTKRVEIALYAVNNCTPVSDFVAMQENYGTLLDRDYVLAKKGKQTNSTYTVIPQDKQKFRNSKVKPYSKSAMLKIIAAAYPISKDYIDEQYGDFSELENDEDDENMIVEEVEERSARRRKNSAAKSSGKEAKVRTNKEGLKYIEDEEDERKKGLSTSDTKRRKKSNTAKNRASQKVTESAVEKAFDKYDIDEDDFLEFFDLEDTEDLTDLTRKKFKEMIDEYLESFDEDEEEDEADEDDDEFIDDDDYPF